MATRMGELMAGILPELRMHAIDKWIRAESDGEVIVDTRRAVVVWEPRRVVPCYAVPDEHIAGELVPYEGPVGAEHGVRIGADGPPVLDPSTPFTVHSCPGTPLSIRTASGELSGAAFRPDDPDLSGYVVLDWSAFTQWYEEEQPVLGHPHDPFDRIDCLPSTRHVIVSLNGRVLADSSAPTLLFETPLPMRFYLPREDVRMELLRASERHTVCAYKGLASYWSAEIDGVSSPDVAWSYEHPLHDALPVAGLIAFLTERLDLNVDGVDIERPVTPWS
ncbi:DUF427 domain-containing protein [Micromonospora sp. DT81.3]|uniref:DUF427 domain-containing protein n=1 Tax=Micromonospora sp. DT81.3 TaxID=3416523 RepID=UPI003CEE438D